MIVATAVSCMVHVRIPSMQILHACNNMSAKLHAAVKSRIQTALTDAEDSNSAAATVHVSCPTWPVYVTLTNCNITLTDGLPQSVKERGGEELGLDLQSPNPFVRSFHAIAEGQVRP